MIYQTQSDNILEMDLLELEENELKEIKQTLIADGTVFEKKKITEYDAKFFETVTLSNYAIKFFLFISLGVYAAINLSALIASMIYRGNFSGDIIGILIGLAVICLIVSAIFSNVNTNRKKEKFPIFIKGESFIFNFSDGVTETLNLFYSLPYESVQKIEFVIYGIKKKQLFGSVTFTFKVLDYTVTHTIRYTNLTAIKDNLKIRFPELLDKLIIDGNGNEKTKNRPKLKNHLISLAILAAAVSLIAVPRLLNFNSIALTISGALLILTAIIVFLSCYINLLNQGIIISSVFIIIGFCVPLLIIEFSKTPIFDYIIRDPEILMPTIFGIIGLCLYVYILITNVNKIHYIIKKK